MTSTRDSIDRGFGGELNTLGRKVTKIFKKTKDNTPPDSTAGFNSHLNHTGIPAQQPPYFPTTAGFPHNSLHQGNHFEYQERGNSSYSATHHNPAYGTSLVQEPEQMQPWENDQPGVQHRLARRQLFLDEGHRSHYPMQQNQVTGRDGGHTIHELAQRLEATMDPRRVEYDRDLRQPRPMPTHPLSSPGQYQDAPRPMQAMGVPASGWNVTQPGARGPRPNEHEREQHHLVLTRHSLRNGAEYQHDPFHSTQHTSPTVLNGRPTIPPVSQQTEIIMPPQPGGLDQYHREHCSPHMHHGTEDQGFGYQYGPMQPSAIGRDGQLHGTSSYHRTDAIPRSFSMRPIGSTPTEYDPMSPTHGYNPGGLAPSQQYGHLHRGS